MNAPSPSTPSAPAASRNAAAIMFIRAATSLHPGSGTALGVIDLPIEREPHTHWPAIPGSSLKGVLRDAVRESNVDAHTSRKDADAAETVAGIFGPPTTAAADHAGALSISDARILAFPVRSMKGVFAWVTCIEVLHRFARDVALAGIHIDAKPPAASPLPDQCFCMEKAPMKIESNGSLLLEEFDFAARPHQPDVKAFLTAVAKLILPNQAEHDDFIDRLVVLHADDFTHFVRHATHVQARIAINYDTKIVRDGALFYEEFLPPESILYSLLFATRSRNKPSISAPKPSLSAREVIEKVNDTLRALPYLQIGGGQTTGCGICTVHIHLPKETK